MINDSQHLLTAAETYKLKAQMASRICAAICATQKPNSRITDTQLLAEIGYEMASAIIDVCDLAAAGDAEIHGEKS